MPSFRWIVLAAATLPILALARAQAPTSGAGAGFPGGPPRVPLFTPIQKIEVPDDPLELVPRDAQYVTGAEERAAAMELLVKAQRLSNVRLQPYDMKTSFNTSGSSSSEGAWMLEDISPGADLYRWTAQGPSYFGVFLSKDRLFSSNQQNPTIPLRLIQVRDAIFYPPTAIGPASSVRVATESLDGTPVECVLVSFGPIGKSPDSFSSGRSYQESESCVDTRTGLLMSYSPVPGLYVQYSYQNAIHFHRSIVWSGFTISENGRAIIEAKTESVTDPPAPTADIFQPGALYPVGAGVLHGRGRGWTTSFQPGVSGNPVVVVHGLTVPKGSQESEVGRGLYTARTLQDAEVISSTDPSLNDAAIKFAGTRPAAMLSFDQPGAAPRTVESFWVIEFSAPPPCPDGSQRVPVPGVTGTVGFICAHQGPGTGGPFSPLPLPQ